MNIVLIKPNETSFQKNDERYEHIKKILHKTVGDTFDAGIINGVAGIAKITAIDEKKLDFTFEPYSDEKSASGKKLYPVTLIVGFPRPIQLRRLFRDVASLGVKKIILVGTELGEKSYLKSNIVTDGSAEKMLEDGAAQAASTNVTELEFCEKLTEGVSRASTTESPALKICLDNVNASCGLGEFLEKSRPSEIIATIGSERGWSDNERALLEKNGFTRCSMGERILRTETAATVATSIILEKMGVLC